MILWALNNVNKNRNNALSPRTATDVQISFPFDKIDSFELPQNALIFF